MWARVYAEDIVSEFEQKGMFNAQIGKKYRENVLSKGATIDELTQVVEFLGREPEQTAFLQSLGI
jgi:thimet oligopeptidase